MEFYKVLHEIMDEKGMSIPDVARACDLTDSTIRSIIDRKQKKVALNVAFKLHYGLNVSLERLNGESDAVIEQIPENTRGSDSMPISDNIKYLRSVSGLSQSDFGKLFGVSDKAVSTWETGQREPRMGVIQKMAEKFDLKKGDIIDGDLRKISISTASPVKLSVSDQLLLDAYHAAPQQIKDIVDVTLAPYKPVQIEDEEIS